MVGAGLLTPIGDKRGRRYQRSDELADIWLQIRRMRLTSDNTDPYQTVQA